VRKAQCWIQGLLALMVLTSGAISPARPVGLGPSPGQLKPGSIKGRVFNSDLNQPIVNASITIREHSALAGRTTFETRTDGNGNYSFQALGPSVYMVSIRAPSPASGCHLYLQTFPGSTEYSNGSFEAHIGGIEIRSGKEIVRDFTFACKKNVALEQYEKKSIKPALEMLKARGVGFDPNVLLEDDWRPKLERAFAQMPEFQKEIRIASPMKGLYLAGKILLPSRVDLNGDTVMLVREFASVEGNSSIWITGKHRLVILVIGDPNRPQPRPPRFTDKFLRIEVSGACGLSGIPPSFDLNVQCPERWLEKTVN
jgi:Carboxypeptidase regulatory-like domain